MEKRLIDKNIIIYVFLIITVTLGAFIIKSYGYVDNKYEYNDEVAELVLLNNYYKYSINKKGKFKILDNKILEVTDYNVKLNNNDLFNLKDINNNYIEIVNKYLIVSFKDYNNIKINIYDISTYKLVKSYVYIENEFNRIKDYVIDGENLQIKTSTIDNSIDICSLNKNMIVISEYIVNLNNLNVVKIKDIMLNEYLVDNEDECI